MRLKNVLLRSAIVLTFTAWAAKTKIQQEVITTTPKRANITRGTIDPSSGNLRVSQINSCGTLDRIPWLTKTNGKRTRRIFSDLLRLDREKNFNQWELYQVLDDKGQVSFIFEKIFLLCIQNK